MKLPVIYEYAGFKYVIDYDQGRYIAIPIQGQHRAANKEKHRKAAIGCFIEENLIKVELN